MQFNNSSPGKLQGCHSKVIYWQDSGKNSIMSNTLNMHMPTSNPLSVNNWLTGSQQNVCFDDFQPCELRFFFSIKLNYIELFDCSDL